MKIVASGFYIFLFFGMPSLIRMNILYIIHEWPARMYCTYTVCVQRTMSMFCIQQCHCPHMDDVDYIMR